MRLRLAGARVPFRGILLTYPSTFLPLQADAVEAALLAALPLGPQTPAGGVMLPEAFKVGLKGTDRGCWRMGAVLQKGSRR